MILREVYHLKPSLEIYVLSRDKLTQVLEDVCEKIFQTDVSIEINDRYVEIYNSLNPHTKWTESLHSLISYLVNDRQFFVECLDDTYMIVVEKLQTEMHYKERSELLLKH